MISPAPSRPAWLLAAVLVTGALAQEPTPPALEPPDVDGLTCLPAPPEGEREILRLWWGRGAALRAGNDAEAERVLVELEEEMRNRRIDRLPALSAALLAESERLVGEGNFGKALEAAEWAVVLDSDSAMARRQLARAGWKGGGGLLASVGARLSAGTAGLNTFWGGYGFLVNAVIVAALALVAAGAVFSLTLLARHGSSFVHEWVERLPRHWSEHMRKLVGRAVLFLPLAVFVGGAWVLLWLPAVLARHVTKAERVVSILLFVLLVVSGPALVSLDHVLSAAVSPTARLLAEPETRGRHALGEMRTMAEAQPEIAPYRFILGNLYAAQIHGTRTTQEDEACFVLAEREYREAIRLAPSEPRFRINLGNLYVRNGSFREGWRRYQQALEIAPDSVLAAYNLAAAYSEDINRLEDREQMLARARSEDEEELAELMERGGGTDVIDAALTWREMGLHILREAHGETGTPSTVLGGLTAPGSIAGMTALLLALTAFLVVGRRPSRRCTRCGRPFCHRCKTDREGKDFCAQCLHLFLRRDGVAPEVRERKTREIDRFERRGRIGSAVFRLVAPGVERLMAGRTLAGCLGLALWAGGLLWLLLVPRLLVRPDAPLASFGDGPGGPVIVLLVAVWIASNVPRRLYRTKGKV